MLKPVPSARLLRALRASIDGVEPVCSSRQPHKARCTLRSRLSTVTRIAPATAVNAQRNIPAEYRELYESLNILGDAASVYVNVSQLKLALRNLETKNSVTRVASSTSTSN